MGQGRMNRPRAIMETIMEAIIRDTDSGQMLGVLAPDDTGRYALVCEGDVLYPGDRIETTGGMRRVGAVVRAWAVDPGRTAEEREVAAVFLGEAKPPAPAPGPRVVLTRERLRSSGREEYCVRGEYVAADDVRDVHVDLGAVPAGGALYDASLPPCPDCGGRLVWAEAGYVPGTRECTGCSGLFSVHEED